MRPVILLLCIGTMLTAFEGSPTISVSLATPTSSDFRIGDSSGSWDDAYRYDLEVTITQGNANERMSGWGGGYFTIDDRSWSGGANADVDYGAWGLGLLGGAAVHLLPPERRSLLDLTLEPYGRAGIAFQNGSFRNLSLDGDTGDGDIDGMRWDLGLGLDLHATIAGRFHARAGLGASLYFSTRAAYFSTGSGGAIGGVSLDLESNEGWARLAFGVTF